tara:strand:- start:15650 stop:16216 length:567 start_codon:yes stop_codon:yes gene_type:complete
MTLIKRLETAEQGSQQWYAFSCRPMHTVEAADAFAAMTGADAFAVMQTPTRRLPRSTVRVQGDPVCVLPSYVFAGFDETPNFFRLERMRERTRFPLWPIKFSGSIKPLNRMNVGWITQELPSPLHRHYDDPPATGVERFKVGDVVKRPHGTARIQQINGTKLLLDLALLGKQMEIEADAAEIVVSRVA